MAFALGYINTPPTNHKAGIKFGIPKPSVYERVSFLRT
ncbi:hypothetical protein AO367_0794 [Moraxella catarrhalis]|nr:hypothetical protein AO381_1723 [Moraxella catarrhalis]OAV31514.1 hypothetical protein AO367_0794 [Moraxella catarrhalis]